MTAPAPAQTVELTFGFTKSDRSIDYCSFDDGYRPGARQELVTLTVRTGGLPEMTTEDWANAAYEATNAPGVSDPAARRIVEAISVAQQAGQALRMRTFAVGDTLTVNGNGRVSCEKRGWAPAPLAAEPPLARGDLVTLEGCTSPTVFRVVSVDRGGSVPLAFVTPANIASVTPRGPAAEGSQWIAVGSLVLQSSLGAL